ncbi:glutathione S-transferase omega-1-like isoform X2 [Haliotis rubra]|nr:glutathione S-transferase omega-1-like isoform X2 [Haliotis rubra]
MALTEDTLRKPTDPLQEGLELRMYSMRMCPYAQRARLVLAAKGVKYNCINIDLNNKPDWFFDYNPYGEVPVVIHNGNNVYESLICAEYLEEAFSTPILYSSEPMKRAWEKIYFNHWTKKGIPAFYSLLKAGHLDPELTNRLNEHVATMDQFLKKADTPYFHGNAPGFPDYMIWPWFERIPMMGQITGYKMDETKYPTITAWVARMWKDPVVQECKIDGRLFVDHYDKYRTGKPDFTIGADPKRAPVEEALENLDGLRDPKTRFKQT